MVVELPCGVIHGQIYRHTRFYQDATGQWQSKYLLILAGTAGGDVIFRLLTSRQQSRPERPPCYHGDPYPSFYLGYLGGPLTAKSWLDLRKREDYESGQFQDDLSSGALGFVLSLPCALFRQALDCAANADDTTNAQGNAMKDLRTELRCP